MIGGLAGVITNGHMRKYYHSSESWRMIRTFQMTIMVMKDLF